MQSLTDQVALVTGGAGPNGLGFATAPGDRMRGILEPIPLNRIGERADVAGCVVILASDLARHCTGVTLDVDGGMPVH